MSGEIKVRKKKTEHHRMYWVVTLERREITSAIATREYAEDLAQNAQYHLDNYTWFRCDNGYLEYSDKACDECKGRRWGFITALIREGSLPGVVETKHCDCLLLTPSSVCEKGQRLHQEATQAGTLDAWELYVRHTRGEDA